MPLTEGARALVQESTVADRYRWPFPSKRSLHA